MTRVSILRRLKRPRSGAAVLLSGVLFGFSFWLIQNSFFGLGRLEAIAGTADILDTRFTYSAETAAAVLEKLGETGRNYYLSVIQPLDILFPLCYGVFFLMLIQWGWFGQENTKDTEGLGVIHRAVLLLPLATAACDILENILIRILVLNYPEEFTAVASSAGVITAVKFVLFSLSAAAATAGLLRRLTHENRLRRHQHENID